MERSKVTLHPTKPVPRIERYGHAAHPVTNWPNVLRVKGALGPGAGTPRQKNKGMRRATASALLEKATRDARAWNRRVMLDICRNCGGICQNGKCEKVGR